MSMETVILLSASLMAIAIAIYLVNKSRKAKRKKDYEILMSELRSQIDAQKELVVSLTEAAELAISAKEIGMNEVFNAVGAAARERLQDENEKMKAQLDLYLKIEKKYSEEFS